VLERGEVANSWRRERWDSLRLLTPNWQCGLPGVPYEGADPDGYMTTAEVVELIDRFAARARVRVRTGTNVTSVRRTDDGYRVRTSDGEIRSRTVVIASGACNHPTVPGLAQAVPAEVEQLTPLSYSNPAKLPEGGVLVVGASATGARRSQAGATAALTAARRDSRAGDARPQRARRDRCRAGGTLRGRP
jgi:putative flavoprotein involved in K+ transport